MKREETMKTSVPLRISHGLDILISVLHVGMEKLRIGKSLNIMDYSSKGMNTNESVSEKLRVSSLN